MDSAPCCCGRRIGWRSSGCRRPSGEHRGKSPCQSMVHLPFVCSFLVLYGMHAPFACYKHAILRSRFGRFGRRSTKLLSRQDFLEAPVCSFVCLICLCLITRSCMSIGLLPLDHCLMCLALTNAFISDLIRPRPRRTLYYFAMVLGMVLDWFSSPALFPPSISSSCWVCVFRLLCVFGGHTR